MPDDKLLDFARAMLSNGRSAEHVISILVSNGLAEDEAKKIVSLVQTGNKGGLIFEVAKQGARATTFVDIVKGVGLSIALLITSIVLVVFGAPWYIILFFLAPIGLQVLDIIRLKRISSISSKLSAPSEPAGNNIEKIEEENVVLTVPGIMRAGFGIRGVSFLGKGEIKEPENAMILTNKRLCMIVVPVPGADKLVDGVDVGMWQWLLNSDGIRKKLEAMIDERGLYGTLKSDARNFCIKLSDIKLVRYSKLFSKLDVILADRRKFSYSLRSYNDATRLLDAFSRLGLEVKR